MSLRLKSIVLSLLVLILISISPFMAEEVTIGNQEDPMVYSLEVKIIDAWYEDAGGDGKENDVIVMLEFDVINEKNNKIRYVINLELPSGLVYSYSVVIESGTSNFVTKNVFWNHATESGWYTTSVSAYINSKKATTENDELIFDPPGGDESDPTLFSVGIV